MKRILVIDGDAGVSLQLSRAFRAWGYQVETAATGAIALERDPHAYDLITLDILLPIINGKTVAETFARQKARTPVVVISQVGNPEVRREMSRFPFVRGWFQKPLDYTSLKEHVNQLFFGIKSRRDRLHPAPAAMDVFNATPNLSPSGEFNQQLLARHSDDEWWLETNHLLRSGVQGGMRVRPRDGGIMVKVPAGTAYLGDAHGEPAERPEVEVHVPAFFIDKYPVTNAQYTLFLTWMEKTEDPHRFCHPDEPAKKNHMPHYWHELQWSKDEYPVVGVDWFDAYAYSRWALERRDLTALPAEAQWERSCRGDSRRRYPWGAYPPTRDHANFDRAYGFTSAVGLARKGKSPFGVHDLAGNVWEWCQDWFDEGFYSKLAAASRTADTPIAMRPSLLRSLRGGSWLNQADMLRASYRGSAEPLARYYHVGFRCACPVTVWEKYA